MDSLSSRILGFEARIDKSWDVGRVGEGRNGLISSDRAVRSVVRDARKSHDEIQKFPLRSSNRSPERWDRAKKSETSTEEHPPFRQTIDSIFSFRQPSSPGVSDEMMEVGI